MPKSIGSFELPPLIQLHAFSHDSSTDGFALSRFLRRVLIATVHPSRHSLAKTKYNFDLSKIYGGDPLAEEDLRHGRIRRDLISDQLMDALTFLAAPGGGTASTGST